jgi:predicted N-acetyltransferase YhbS
VAHHDLFRFSPETSADEAEVEYLFDLSFAPGRGALSSYRLRDDVAKVADLSLVARDPDGILAGAIRYWPIRIGAEGHRALLLGPVAVHPTHQGEGLGAALILESLARARATGWTRVVLVGDAPYYARFGFARADALQFPPPTNPDRLLYLELVEGAFDGVAGLVRKDA